MSSPYQFFKKVAFKIDPETVHNITIEGLHHFPALASRAFHFLGKHQEFNFNNRFALETNMGIWPFPIGLAAGLDKDAKCVDFFTSLPFGAVEIGTLTWRPQPGNPRPRLFRLEAEESLLNRMGFNNAGAEVALKHLMKLKIAQKHGKPVGANIGKNKDTSLDQAPLDYQNLYRLLAPNVDYLTINVSSPNTPNLRQLESCEGMKHILDALSDIRCQCPRPLYVKISPDLPHAELDAVIELAMKHKLAGIVGTNTTIMPEYGVGGISGKLLAHKSFEMRKRILEIIKGVQGFELIAVGGISNVGDLWRLWKQGGKVAQIYTAFIYNGPKLLYDLAIHLDFLLQAFHFKSLEELIKNMESLPDETPALPIIS
ncbi:MAG: quinone-dependent dihydroorotate dehydrogenase [Bdellovibrio sp.]|nr:quinone-dependent dihydroorotate dehydrogenase [Bdellovibrio sp.]